MELIYNAYNITLKIIEYVFSFTTLWSSSSRSIKKGQMMNITLLKNNIDDIIFEFKKYKKDFPKR